MKDFDVSKPDKQTQGDERDDSPAPRFEQVTQEIIEAKRTTAEADEGRTIPKVVFESKTAGSAPGMDAREPEGEDPDPAVSSPKIVSERSSASWEEVWESRTTAATIQNGFPVSSTLRCPQLRNDDDVVEGDIAFRVVAVVAAVWAAVWYVLYAILADYASIFV